jgi:hypothetical protein
MRKQLRHSGRRAFLRGLGGTALGLPLLEFTHGHLWAGGSAAPLRFVTMFEHGGTISNHSHSSRHDGTGFEQGEDWWRPADPTSTDLVLGPIHQPLAAFRSKLLLLEGVDNKAAMAQAQYGSGGHGISNVTALTAATASDPHGEDPIAQGPSIDQVIAERLAARQPVPFPLMHLVVEGHQYGSPFFRAAGERVGGEGSPSAAFATFFAGVSGGEPSPAQVRQIAMRTSMLDGLLDSYEQAKGRVSAKDLQIIEAHLDHLRALEYELQHPVVCTPPTGIDADGNQPGDVVGPLHVKLIIAALRCGVTNVANLEIADIITPWTPIGDPMDAAFGIGHSLGHFARDVGEAGPFAAQRETWLAEMLDNRQWRIGLMAQLLEGLDDPGFLEGDRTLLDNAAVLWTSEFREPANHVSSNVQVLLAGSAGGYFSTGRFLDYNVHASDPATLEYESNESTHNLFTSLLQAMGESDGHFGSADAAHEGPLPDLTA